MPNKGYKQTKEHIEKMVLSHKGMKIWNRGIPQSSEAKEKNRLAHLGKSPWNKGLKGVMKPNETSFKKGHTAWNSGKKGVYSEERLKQMSEMKKGIPAWNKGKPWSEEVKLKLSKAHIGLLTKDKHPNWQGGITKINLQIRNSFKYSEWRKEIFERDNYTCYKCGTRTGPLNVHHILAFSAILKEYKINTIEDAFDCNSLWDVTNGITVCKLCHKKIHRSKKWSDNYE